MDNCNGSATPADSNIAIEIINDDLLNEDDKKRYQSILGAIMYASNKVMFPLLNITNNLSSYMNNVYGPPTSKLSKLNLPCLSVVVVYSELVGVNNKTIFECWRRGECEFY